jgi:hypothetical protein
MQTLSYLECELPLPTKMAQIHRLSGISRIILAYFSFTRSIALLTLPVVRFGVPVLEKTKLMWTEHDDSSHSCQHHQPLPTAYAEINLFIS